MSQTKVRKMLFGSSVSNKRCVGCCLELYMSNKLSLYKLRNMFSMRKDDCREMLKRLIAFAFERDKCFLFQTLAFLLQCPLLFIELNPLESKLIKSCCASNLNLNFGSKETWGESM
ncbi:hypothetical protein MtrunA17_Chr4g0027891 [Medicago truncatula]|uniref:Uncharacterized protein n=1 Tax=Medicago truncatula TaxID=3880 RepID=A0A072UJU9_MEDTR|nr:hypothetical protein MTR_4g057133 [Medicago truncatula]RHN60627.1 hypothetical protein MtrunA17_Chr4g0027891 [Medicago truncatula]